MKIMDLFKTTQILLNRGILDDDNSTYKLICNKMGNYGEIRPELELNLTHL